MFKVHLVMHCLHFVFLFSCLLCFHGSLPEAARPPTEEYSCTFGNGRVLVDATTKEYSIILPYASFLGQTLVGGSYRLFYNETWYTNPQEEEGPLLVDRNVTTTRGVDSLGQYDAISIVWTWGTDGAWTTSFKCYESVLVFAQSFPSGFNDQPGGSRDLDTPSAVFPSFVSSDFAFQNVRLATFFGQNAAKSTRYGSWPQAYAGGYIGGPLCLFGDPLEATGAIILSPLTHHMLAIHQIAERGNGEVLEFGLEGLLHTIPSNFSIEFVLYAGAVPTAQESEHWDGQYAGIISQNFMEWGDILLKKSRGKKKRTPPDKNMWINQLGFSTTGVYHYNPCDCLNNSHGWGCQSAFGLTLSDEQCNTYEDNVHLVRTDATTKEIPYAWVLIDSWWHAYNNHRPPVNMPYSHYFEDVPEQVGEIFPHTLRKLHDSTGFLFGAHWSSSFSPDSPYRSIGAWECGNNTEGAEVQCIPVANVLGESTTAFDYIFKSDLRWGMKVLKMDHVLNIILGDKAASKTCGHKSDQPCRHGERNASIAPGSLFQMLTTTDVSDRYFDGLGVSAEKHGIDIMLCMSFPNVLMHSVNLVAVTHGRGSTDSHPRHNAHGFPYDNWKGFGGESTFLWSLGLWPFKDTFYSNSSSRVRNKFAEDYGGTETMPFTQALVSALGGGGFAPGGPVGDADVALLMMSCDKSGTLLKPSTPAMYIDRVWSGDERVGETSVAITSIGLYMWRYTSIINNTEFLLYPRDVGIVATDAVEYVAYFWCSSRPLGKSCESKLLPFDSETPVMVPSSNWTESNGAEAQYVLITPRLSGKWVLMGEFDKFVPVSKMRVESFSAKPSAVTLNLIVRSVGEVLHFRFGTPRLDIVHARCVVRSRGRLQMTVYLDHRVECSQ